MLKVMCKELGVERLDLVDERLSLSFAKDCRVSPERITDLIQADPQRFRLTPDSVLHITIPPGQSANPLEVTKNVLQDLA
jgi:transcription-repair coupling factor (superfamily II helicase)